MPWGIARTIVPLRGKPTLSEKASALAFSLNKNHAFKDGNKRVGFLALEVFLQMNGYETTSDVDENERVALSIADGSMSRDDLAHWIKEHFRAI